MTTLTFAMTLLTTTQTFVGSPLLAGSVAVALVMGLTVTAREQRVVPEMDNRTRADIGLSPFAPSWLAIRN